MQQDNTTESVQPEKEPSPESAQPEQATAATGDSPLGGDAIDMGPQDAPADLGAALEEARLEAEKWRDQALRAAADAQNIRQRAERDVEKAHKFGLEKFAESLLPVYDSLTQALAVQYPPEAEAAMVPMREGIELTLKILLDTLARYNVECIDPEGQPFNPQLHEAVTMIENPECEPNTVLNVFQKGFTLNGRLVRAAKVVVSRGPAAPVNEQA